MSAFRSQLLKGLRLLVFHNPPLLEIYDLYDSQPLCNLTNTSQNPLPDFLHALSNLTATRSHNTIVDD